MTELAAFYRKKVVDFLKTVVCFDDRAYDDVPDNCGDIKSAEKAMDGFSEETSKATEVIAEKSREASGLSPAGFDTMALTDAFADMEILCSVIKPHADVENAQAQIGKLARTADVAILDWELVDNEGKKNVSITRDAIVRLVTEDERRGGCLRLVVIYSDGDGPNVINELFMLLEKYGFKKSSDNFELQNTHSLIVFFQKPERISPTAPVVPYKDLPKRVVDSFTRLTSGLLPAAALSAISVIRQHSHHLLATFPATLDGAFLTHRCLVPDPNDAEQFLLDLFEGEIGALLAHSCMREAVDKIRCMAWVNKNNNFSSTQKERLRKALTKYSKAKIEGFKELFGETEFTDGVISEKVLELLYITSPQDMVRAKEDFTVLSTLDIHRRQITSRERPPRLHLGSIVRETGAGRYLLCIQPLCDSTRIGHNRETVFPFLILDAPPEPREPELCIPDGEDGAVWLSISPKPQQLITYRFCGKSSAIAYVEANKLGVRDDYVFRTSDGKCLEWMADLKIGKAQRIVSQLASRIHTLGINEFEWLRLQRPRPN